MKSSVNCPACEGRGIYCQRAKDNVWSELMVRDLPCVYCNGTGTVTRDDPLDYDPQARSPHFPYRDE